MYFVCYFFRALKSAILNQITLEKKHDARALLKRNDLLHRVEYKTMTIMLSPSARKRDHVFITSYDTRGRMINRSGSMRTMCALDLFFVPVCNDYKTKRIRFLIVCRWTRFQKWNTCKLFWNDDDDDSSFKVFQQSTAVRRVRVPRHETETRNIITICLRQ